MKKIIILIAFISLTGCSVLTEKVNETNEKTGATNEDTVSLKSSLNLSGKGLTKVSQDIFENTNLQELNLSNNNLTGSLPAEIRQLKNLVILNASNNAMTGVPAEIGQLTNLQVLYLSNNQLTGLPNELGNLKNLKTLNISGNNYSQQDLDVIIKGLPANINIIK